MESRQQYFQVRVITCMFEMRKQLQKRRNHARLCAVGESAEICTQESWAPRDWSRSSRFCVTLLRPGLAGDIFGFSDLPRVGSTSRNEKDQVALPSSAASTVFILL